MTSDRKKPGVAFWATVVVVCLLMYPISFGPACWWRSDRYGDVFNPDNNHFAPRIYWPIGWLAKNGPRPVPFELICWYATAGGRRLIILPVDANTEAGFMLP